MLALTEDQIAALAAQVAMRRVFVWCEARDPDTGDPDPAGFWDDVSDVELDGRTYYGSGTLVTVSTMSAKSDLSIPGITITLSGIPAVVAAKIRGLSVGQAPVEVSLGIFDVAQQALIPPLIPRFVGFVDSVDIRTPAKGDKSLVVLTCESTSRALTISNPNTRSASTQQQRDADDSFYNYTAGQREQTIYFGQKSPNAAPKASPGGGTGSRRGKE